MPAITGLSKSLAASVLLAAAMPGAADAATYRFDVTVTRSDGAPEYGFPLPAIGTAGRLHIDIYNILRFGPDTPLKDPYAEDPADRVYGWEVLAAIEFFDPSNLTDFGAYLTETVIFPQAGGFRIQNDGSGIYVYGDSIEDTGTLTGDFSIWRDGYPAPQTVGDLVSYLEAPDAVAWFDFSGSVSGDSDTWVRFTATNFEAPVIPLPAGGLLLLSAFGVAGAAKLRRRSSAA